DQLEQRINRLVVQIKVQNGKPLITNNWLSIDNSDIGEGRIFSFSKEDFILLLKQKYGFKEVENNDVDCEERELRINVTRSIIRSCNKKRKVIENVLRGRDYVPGSPLGKGIWIILITFQTKDQYVEEMCQVYDVYRSSEKNKVVQN